MIKLERKNSVKIIIIIVIIIGAGYYLYSNYNIIFGNGEEWLNDNIEPNSTKENIEKVKQDEEENIIIHISGAVLKEGIIELKEESRVADAIEKAGGLKDNACLKDINLAEKLEDGAKIYIPSIEEYEDNKEEKNIGNSYIINTNQNKSNVTNQNKDIRVNINTATQSELEKLPGIGASTALKIITYRNENGKFKKIEDIKKVNRDRGKQI